MVDYNFKYLNIFYITCLIVIYFFVLLNVFYDALDLVLNFFLKNIIIKQFMKLPTLLCNIFFQDSVLLRQKYSSSFLFDHFWFFLLE